MHAGLELLEDMLGALVQAAIVIPDLLLQQVSPREVFLKFRILEQFCI